MSDKHKEFARQLTSQVRPATRNFILSVLLDIPANHAAVVDFGIDSQKHYEALYYALREAEILPKDLDAALGHGQKLTALARAAPSNPHKDVEFCTSWDLVLGRQGPGTTGKELGGQRVMEKPAKGGDGKGKDPDRGIER